MIKQLISIACFLLIPLLGHTQSLSILEYGAVGDGKTDNTQAVQRAIEAASNQKKTLIFPAGTFMTGMIHLKSNLTIELQNGAVWQAMPDLKLFPEIKSNADLSQSGGYTMSRRAFIFGDEIENVVLRGDGTIYPSGDHHQAFPMLEANGSKRPYGIYFRKSNNIKVEGLTLKQSAFWMLRTYLCDNVRLHGLEIFNHANTNNDGIDIVDCHRVHISDCTVDASDDAISLKSEAPKGCEDVTIANCIVSSTASYIKLGTGSFGSFRRIAVSNCVLRTTRSEEVVHGLGYRNGITGLSVISVDGAKVENISFDNIVMDGMMTPIFVRLGNRHRVTHEEYKDVPITPGIIRNIRYADITATNCGPVPISITGYPEHYVENISISQSTFGFAQAGSLQDLEATVPENSQGYPYPKMYGTNLPATGIYLRHARNVQLQFLNFSPAQGDPRPVAHFDDVINLRTNEMLQNYHNLVSKDIVSINAE
ncbi:glycosyl hydrolase family 28 protein [Limibacter armeniacum]|uniref:glycoside hydrolase family 28 protein n=1 Tax=Limibacter armeniacum TaxID=466084 RepID=UPI002FE5E402